MESLCHQESTGEILCLWDSAFRNNSDSKFLKMPLFCALLPTTARLPNRTLFVNGPHCPGKKSQNSDGKFWAETPPLLRLLFLARLSDMSHAYALTLSVCLSV